MNEFLPPWIGIGLILSWLVALAFGLDAYQRRHQLEPETARKLFHVGGGVAALSLPWLFQQLWPAIVLVALASGLLLLMRVVPVLRQGVGQVLHRIERTSAGEFCFLAGTLLVFVLADGNKLLYCIAIAVQVFADTCAALIGSLYGRHRFALMDSWKSVEGSIAFFFTAFLCIYIPILVWTELHWLVSLLIAINMSILLMLIEAISWKGSDNLLLPLFVFVMLKFFLQQNFLELATQLIVILGLSLFVYLWRSRTTLATDSLIGAVLSGYCFWAIGGWLWLIAPTSLFCSHAWLAESTRLPDICPFQLPVLIALVLPGLIWLSGYRFFDIPCFYYPFSLTFAAGYGVIGSISFRLTASNVNFWTIALTNTGKGAQILLPALLIAKGITWESLQGFLAGMFAIWAAICLYRVQQHKVARNSRQAIDWRMMSLIIMGSSLLTLTPFVLLT